MGRCGSWLGCWLGLWAGAGRPEFVDGLDGQEKIKPISARRVRLSGGQLRPRANLKNSEPMKSSPSKFMLVLGWALTIIGALILTPAADLLPVDLFSFLAGCPRYCYFRIIPSTGNDPIFVFGLVLLATGILLLVIRRFLVAR